MHTVGHIYTGQFTLTHEIEHIRKIEDTYRNGHTHIHRIGHTNTHTEDRTHIHKIETHIYRIGNTHTENRITHTVHTVEWTHTYTGQVTHTRQNTRTQDRITHTVHTVPLPNAHLSLLFHQESFPNSLQVLCLCHHFQSTLSGNGYRSSDQPEAFSGDVKWENVSLSIDSKTRLD